jgi:hypothetical protein
MPSAFNVTATTNDVQLPVTRQGSVVLTISNISGKPQQGRVSLAALDSTKATWLGVDGGIDRTFPVGGAQQVTIRIAVPNDAAPGHYTFRPDVVAVQDPDDDSTQGPTLAFEVPPPPPPPPVEPWWKMHWPILAAAATALVLIVGVALYFFVIRPGSETVWVEDAVPAGATTFVNFDSWNWVTSNPTPFSGTRAHQSNLAAGMHQHFFQGASPPLTINPGDSLFTYVFLDPANPPSEVMLQWFDGASWEHRAIWGADLLPYGVAGQPSRFNAGPLPATGQWVRLEVPAAKVGLEGTSITGEAYTLYNGRVTWDRSGKRP